MNSTMTRCWDGGLDDTRRTFIKKGPFGITNTCLETFIKRCAGYYVITCIFGIRDRRLDNHLLRDDGCLFHVDFGYIFGYDPKPLPPPMKLCKDMLEAMGGAKRLDILKEDLVYQSLRKSLSSIHELS
uniref:Phosphatidylinositol 3-kinase, root isoform n=1 Tax=Tanacetum cinerariifolium TaxID=118510 RepID=A0A6L2M9K3_TANCI|nr:phosphatidylinositol 3-kinase, root isoform [Tanacetum cinerariifolium]